MYHQQRNKWYPRRFLLAHFEAALYFSRTKFTCPYNKMTLSYYYWQVHSLLLKSSVASKYSSKNLWGGGSYHLSYC